MVVERGDPYERVKCSTILFACLLMVVLFGTFQSSWPKTGQHKGCTNAAWGPASTSVCLESLAIPEETQQIRALRVPIWWWFSVRGSKLRQTPGHSEFRFSITTGKIWLRLYSIVLLQNYEWTLINVVHWQFNDRTFYKISNIPTAEP